MAGLRVAGVRLTVEGADKFKSDLEAASSALKRNQAEMKVVDAKYGSGSTDKYALQERKTLQEERLKFQRERTKTLQATRDAYAKQADADPKQLQKLDTAILKSQADEAALARQIQETNAAIQKQAAAAGDNASQLEKMAKGAKAAGEKLQETGKKWTKAGTSITKATAPITAAATYAIKSALDLEDAMAVVATMPDVTAEALPKYTEQVLEASDATGVAATEIANAMYQAISAGVAADKAAEFAGTAAKAAKAGLTDTTTVVNGATSILNAWGDAAGGIDHVLDVMMVTQNEGKITIGEIASQIGDLTGLAPQVGVSFEQVSAAVAALTKMGLPANKAFTGLKAVMSNVIKPTSQAATEAKRLGLDFSAAALQTKGFSGFLEDIMEKTGGSEDSLAKLFGSVEALNEIMALGGEQGQAYFASTMAAIGSASGTMQEAFDTRTSSRAQQLSMSLNRLKNAGADLGENMMPAVDAVTNLVSGLGNMLGSMDEGTQGTLATVTALTVALGPATAGVGKVVSGMGTLLKVAGTLMPLMSGPLGFAVAGMGAAALTVALAGAGAQAEKMDAALQNLNISVNADSVAAITSAINSGIEAANTEHDIKVKTSTEMGEGMDLLSGAMEDGKITNKEFRSVSNWIKQNVIPDMKAAQAEVDAQWKAVYESLGGGYDKKGNATDAEAAAQADAAVAPIREAASELESTVTAFQTLLKSTAQKGVNVTAEELAELQGMMEQIRGLREEIALMTDSDVEAANNAANRVESGYGTEEDLGMAAGYAQGQFENAVETAEEAKKLAKEARDAAIDSALESGDAAAADAAEASYEAAVKLAEDTVAEAKADTIGTYGSLLTGMAKGAGVTEDTLATLTTILDLMAQSHNEIEGDEGQLSESTKKALLDNDRLKSLILGDDSQYLGMSYADMMENPALAMQAGILARQMFEGLPDAMNKLNEESGGGLDTMMTYMQGMIDGINPDDLDWSQADGWMAALMKTALLQEDGTSALSSEEFQAIGSALATGLTESVPEVESAASGLGAAATDGMSNIDGASPAAAGAQAFVDALSGAAGSAYAAGYSVGAAGAAGMAAGFGSGGYVGLTNGTRPGVNIPTPGAGMIAAMMAPPQLDAMPTVPQLAMAGGGSGSVSNSSSVVHAGATVNIGTVRTSNTASIRALAKELDALNNRSLAGVGLHK